MITAKCPNCGSDNNAHKSVMGTHEEFPHMGDLSICSQCAVLSEYVDEDGGLEIFTDWDKMPTEVYAVVTRAQAFIKNSIDVNDKGW